MSRARQAGISYDDASVAFGCHPETMRQHYVNMNETAISDHVMDGIHKLNDTAKNPGIKNTAAKSNGGIRRPE
jgi:hypothetical protein